MLTAILALLVLGVFISRHRDVRTASNVLVWGGIGSMLFIALGMSNPDIEMLLFGSDPHRFYGEGAVWVRDLLLAFVVGYTCLWFVRPRGASTYDGQADGPGRVKRGLQGSMVAFLVALSSACVVYVVESVVPYDENTSRLLAAFDYGSYGYGDARWRILLQLYAYTLEVCMITAAGAWAYSRIRHIQGSGAAPSLGPDT